MSSLSPVIRQQAWKLGIVAPGAVLSFYLSGTSTPSTAYLDAALGTATGATLTADSSGRFEPFWLGAWAYRMTLRDSLGAVVWGPTDDITNTSIGGSTAQVQFNDGGVLAGDAGLTYNKTTDALTVLGDIVVGTGVVRANSADGADGSTMIVAGGGGGTQTRGGMLRVYGNESASTGKVQLVAGNVTGSAVEVLRADGSVALVVDGATGAVSLGLQPRAGAYHTALQSLATSTETPITFNTEDFDVGALHDVSTNPTRFTVPAGGAGVYLLTGSITYATAASTVTRAWWKKNGTTHVAGGVSGLTSAASSTSLCVTALVTLAAADYVELIGFQSTGGALNTGDAATRYLQNSAQVLKVA